MEGIRKIPSPTTYIQLDPSHKKYNEKKMRATFEVYTTLNFTYVLKCFYVFAIYFLSCFSCRGMIIVATKKMERNIKIVQNVPPFDFLFAVYDVVEYSMCVSGDTEKIK